jgi:hypothetical protein
MLALILTSFITVLLFTFLGIIASKILKVKTAGLTTVFLGLVSVNTLCLLLSFAIPINILTLGGMLIGIIPFLYLQKADVINYFSNLKHQKISIFFSLPIVFAAAFISSNQPLIFDAGLYHLQSIQWIESYSVVPGLANLHGRFGFNPNIFLVFSLTTFKEIFGQPIFILNFIFFSLFTHYLIHQMYLCAAFIKNYSLLFFNAAILISVTGVWLSVPEPNVLLGLGLNLSTPTPDLIAILLPLYILTHTVNLQYTSNNNFEENGIVFFILGLYVITVKLSALPILIIPLYVLLKQKQNYKKLMGMAVLAAIVIGPWLVRNIILSGWLIYPFYHLDLFNFDWKVPIADVIFEKNCVTGWARIPSERFLEATQMRLFEWFPLWWSRFKLPEQLFYGLSFFMPLISMLLLALRIIKYNALTFVVLITAYLGALFWFFLAPDIRFGFGFLLISSLSLLMFIRVQYSPVVNKFLLLTFFVYIIYFCFNEFVFINLGDNSDQIFSDFKHRIYKPLAVKKPDDFELLNYKIGNIILYYPKHEGRCFDAALPCSMNFKKKLKARGSEIKHGFQTSH